MGLTVFGLSRCEIFAEFRGPQGQVSHSGTKNGANAKILQDSRGLDPWFSQGAVQKMCRD